jgi:hypothetical protein
LKAIAMDAFVDEFERLRNTRQERRAEQGNTWKDGAKQSAAKPFPFTLPKDITLEPKEFLIEGFLGRRETSAWYGPPDAGKSAVMTYATACVAAGIEFCGRRVIQGPVLYVAAERGAIVKRRVKAWCIEHGLPDIPLAVLDHAVDLRTSKIDAERVIATATALAALCKQPVIWIAFDTLNRILGGGDENSSKDMGAVIASIDRIQRETGAHCSLIHHVPADRNDRMRGHSSVLGAVNMTVRITKDGDTVNLEVDKANDLVDKPRFTFTFKSVVLCRDEETGAETTAPVMVPAEVGPAAAKARPAKKLPNAAKIALRAFTEALDRHGQPGPASNYVPPNVRVVTEENWRAVCNQIGISSGERRAKERAFGRARDKLVADQIVGTYEGLYWAGRS